MSKKTDYIKLCKSLRKDSPCILCQTDNKYVCAHILVKGYVNNDLDKLKKLKADGLILADSKHNFDQSISLTSLIVAILTIVISMKESDVKILSIVSILFLVILCGFLICLIRNIIIGIVFKYHYYIDLAIEELEKELTSS